MESTREALGQACFQARGKWYLAREVDEFLAQLAVRAEEDSRQAEDRLRQAQGENCRLREELASLRQEMDRRERESPEARQRRVLEELEGERDQLIGDIKALRQFREKFRQAVEEDAHNLLRQAQALPSETLL